MGQLAHHLRAAFRRSATRSPRSPAPARRRACRRLRQCSHGVGQAVRLVRRAAERMRRQKRRVGLDEELVGGDQSGGLAQLAGIAKADRARQAQQPPGLDAGAGHVGSRREAVEDHDLRRALRGGARRGRRRRRRGCGSSAACRCAWPGRCATRTPRAARPASGTAIEAARPVQVHPGLADRDHALSAASRSSSALASSVSAFARVGCSATAAYTRGSHSVAAAAQRADARSSAIVTTASTPTACARSRITRTSSASTAPHASRWVWASTSGPRGCGAGGGSTVELTGTHYGARK